MNYFWISWYETSEDHRPINFPPNESVLGWWCSGYRCHDNAATLVAHVQSESEEKAQMVVMKDWPGDKEWRFCNLTDCKPPGDRFPPSEWSKSRYEKASKEENND